MGNGNDQSIYTDEECVLLERFANTPNPETGRYPSDEACDRYAERLRDCVRRGAKPPLQRLTNHSLRY
jgi:hypothetical protein